MNNEEVSQLLEEHRGLILKCASEFHNTGLLTRQDYIQIAKIAFVKAYPKWDSKKSKFSTYMYNCMRNAILSQFNGYKTKVFKKMPNISLEYVDTKESIFDIIPENLLSNKEFQIVQLYVEGYSLREIGKQLNEPVSKVKVLLSGVINKLKEYYEKN